MGSTVATFTIDHGKAKQILAKHFIKPRLIKAGDIVKKNVRSLVPTDSGVMRQHVETRLQYPKIFIGFFDDTWPAEAPYYFYVEFGTGQFAEKGNGRKTPWVYYSKKLNRFVYTTGMKARPSLRPGLFISRGELQKLFSGSGLYKLILGGQGTYSAEKGTDLQVL